MDRWLIEALKKHSISDAHVLVFGSQEPWYEALALVAGAASITTSEYNKLRYEHKLMHQFQPRKLPRSPREGHGGGYDVAFSISSFDHDGLGR